MVNQKKADYKVTKDDRIAQMIIEKSDDQELLEVQGLANTERAGSGFGSSDLKAQRPTVCFLQANYNMNQYFDKHDEENSPRFNTEIEMLSNAIIAKAELKKFDVDFLRKVKEAATKDEEWVMRRQELERLRNKGTDPPKFWTLKDELIYYKDRLFIPAVEGIQTLIMKGCHDSKVAGHFGQEKTLEIVTRDIHWKRMADWINDYVRSCDECQHNKPPRHAKYGLLQPL